MINSREIVSAARDALDAGRIDREQFREARFISRIPFVRRILGATLPRRADGAIDWENVDWEALFAVILEFILAIIGAIGARDGSESSVNQLVKKYVEGGVV